MFVNISTDFSGLNRKNIDVIHVVISDKHLYVRFHEKRLSALKVSLIILLINIVNDNKLYFFI